MTNIDFLSELNSSQRAAVEHYCGPLLVVAGAGSGKTRALTFRVANLIQGNKVDPENILAVTFTNKAAKEMKARIENLFDQQMALSRYDKPFSVLLPHEQTQLKSYVYKNIVKKLWVGTFHSLCGQILRHDINKYVDENGRKWDKNFSIFDESDAQNVVKQIVVKEMNLDDKKFDPRQIRYKISNAKNQGLTPNEYLKAEPDYKGRVTAEIYSTYQNKLAENNALDFDDLIRIPVELFQQNPEVLNYWHKQFRHILVDEYQDTNRTQYDFIRLLVTNGQSPKNFKNWENRSIFVVGDVDQSIYSFRMADYRILLEFQEDFGDGLPDDDTRTMVKLEENYRSCQNILQVANHLIELNTQRIDKVLKATRQAGEPIYCYQAPDEMAEARFVLKTMKELRKNNPELGWGSFAILYRTNSQSRPFEDVLRTEAPYVIIGGLKFYDRKEIKDALAYLRAIANPADTVSLLRVINTPKRGIGQATIDNLMAFAQELNVPLWEIISDTTSVATVGGRSAKKVQLFTDVIKKWQEAMQDPEVTADNIVQGVLEDSGYISDLRQQGTEEADGRLENLSELVKAVVQFQNDNESTSLADFLASAALASDLDNLQEGEEAISLMTLHSAKGLEFPVVFLVGLEQGLFPHFRSLDDPIALEEERRLCYVGITRAQEQLFISHAEERSQYWGARSATVPSQFLRELPEHLIEGNMKSQKKVASTEKPQKIISAKASVKSSVRTAPSSNRSNQNSVLPATAWEVGDKVYNPNLGIGIIHKIFGDGSEKIMLAVKFGKSQKIIDPKVTKLTPIE